MGTVERILGPRSKYDRSLPYTYEARFRVFADGEELDSCFADTICGLVEHLHRRGKRPGEVTILEIYQQRETPLDIGLLTTPDGEWLFKPAICQALERHYPGHIAETSCSFQDRDGRAT